jgi:hypothetical protein
MERAHENEPYRIAADVLFRAQLAEIRAKAAVSFEARGIPVGELMVAQCKRCGAPIGHDDEREYRTDDCERECGE